MARRALWIVPILGAVVGLGFAFAALQTDDLTLAVDPCASSFDNPFARFSQLAFLVGVGGSGALFIRAAVRKDRVGMGLAVAAAVGGIVIMLFGLLLASAGYGWHCPNS
ncbi:MAG: hypothetical protein JWR04_914 [Rhodoglobus sp.]|nr:hypothetical protein [Rhodoglobus sp.]